MKITTDYRKVVYLLILSLSIVSLPVYAQLPGAAKGIGTSAQSDVQAAQKKESMFQKLAKKISGDVKKIPHPKQQAKHSQDSAKRTLQVYGWHPSWIGNTYPGYNYNLLTTLSYYSYDIVWNEAGETEYVPNGWDEDGNTQMVDLARSDGCRIDLTVRCQDAKAIDAILNTGERENCINTIVSVITTAPKADGITLSLENIPPGNEIQLTQLVKLFHDTLATLGKTVSIVLPAEDPSSTYQVKVLSTYVDQFIVQGYTYPGKKENSPGPVAPLESGGKWSPHNIKRSVAKYVNDGLPKNKLILALPYYGAVWEVDSSRKDGKKYRYNGQMRYNAIMAHAQKNPQNVQYDSVSHSNYYSYTENGKQYVVFYDNGKSLKAKYEWVGAQGLAGVGIWALGYDDGHKDLWQSLGTKINVVKMDSTLTKTTGMSDSTAAAAAADAGTGTTAGGGTGTGTEAAAGEAAPPPPPTFLEELEAVAKNPKVLTAIVLTLAVFALLGILSSVAFDSVREKIIITEVSRYLMVQGVVLLAFLAFYSVIRFLWKEHTADSYVSPASLMQWLLVCTLVGELLIHILSYPMFLGHVRRGKLP